MNSKRTIYQNNMNAQDFFDIKLESSKSEDEKFNRDDVFMIKKFEEILRELVREKSKKTNQEYFLDFDDLSDYYKEIIVNNLIDDDDYEAYHQYLDSPPIFFTKALFLKYQSEAQKIIDDMCSEVFFSDLREVNGRYHVDKENGEIVVNW